jgi:hypothetical protein
VTLLRLLVPAVLPEQDETLGLPTFRPMAFLSALADKVIPEAEPETNGNGTERARRTTEPATEPAEVDRG